MVKILCSLKQNEAITKNLQPGKSTAAAPKRECSFSERTTAVPCNLITKYDSNALGERLPVAGFLSLSLSANSTFAPLLLAPRQITTNSPLAPWPI